MRASAAACGATGGAGAAKIPNADGGEAPRGRGIRYRPGLRQEGRALPWDGGGRETQC